MNTDKSSQACVLQVCHGYDGPFLECIRQYGLLFASGPCRVTRVNLTGEYSSDARERYRSDEVVFLSYPGKALGDSK